MKLRQLSHVCSVKRKGVVLDNKIKAEVVDSINMCDSMSTRAYNKNA